MLACQLNIHIYQNNTDLTVNSRDQDEKSFAQLENNSYLALIVMNRLRVDGDGG